MSVQHCSVERGDMGLGLRTHPATVAARCSPGNSPGQVLCAGAARTSVRTTEVTRCQWSIRTQS
jgi:hypothetical protein